MNQAMIYHGGGFGRGGALSATSAPLSAGTIYEYLTPEQFTGLPSSGDNPPRLVTVITPNEARMYQALEYPPANWGGAWAIATIRLHPNFAGGPFWGGVVWTHPTAADSGLSAAWNLSAAGIAGGQTLDYPNSLPTGGPVASVAPAAAWLEVQSAETNIGLAGSPAGGALLAVQVYKGADSLTVPAFFLGAWIRYTLS